MTTSTHERRTRNIEARQEGSGMRRSKGVGGIAAVIG